MESTPGNPQQQATPQQPPQTVYLQPGQQAVFVQPQQQVAAAAPLPPGQWVYQQGYAPTATRQPSSGLRITAGILGIALGVWNLVAFFALMASSYGPSTPLVGWVNFLHLVGTLAVLTLGIMIIVKHRRRSRPIPAMLLGAAAALILVDIAVAGVNWAPGIATLTLAGGVPTAVLAALVLSTEGAAARRK